ncbi:hypothetical protein NDU88_003211 [Pleurodeles waltl]|uniref:Uncharacterized protein n=1 Tax=Pleurodeles waltl TaxID=8319 RepID=A0AAV7TP11_PLEWA|nr:hypothetical protein NDU88_003211 [Pleurodeles waltl]
MSRSLRACVPDWLWGGGGVFRAGARTRHPHALYDQERKDSCGPCSPIYSWPARSAWGKGADNERPFPERDHHRRQPEVEYDSAKTRRGGDQMQSVPLSWALRHSQFGGLFV